jgi:LPXTG-motif cell wall-anchored protein
LYDYVVLGDNVVGAPEPEATPEPLIEVVPEVVPEPATEATAPTPVAPATGDMGMIFVIVLALAAAGLFVYKKRARE